MDTISSRENTNYLPVAGLLIGAVGVIVAIICLVQISGLKKSLNAQVTDAVSKIESAQNDARTAVSSSEKAAKDIQSLATQTQSAFTQVGGELGKINSELTKITEAHAKPAAAAAAGTKAGPKEPKEPATAGPDEYVVKPGDSGAKIARANGVSLTDLEAVNPNVNWTKLKVGEKVKLPKKA